MKKWFIILSFLLIAGCQQVEIQEAVQQKENIQHTQQTIENEASANELQPYVEAVKQMQAWESVKLYYGYFQNYANEARINSELYVETYFVDSPRQIYRSSHYIAFQNSLDELYYTEDEGGFTRSYYDEWESTEIERDQLTNPIPELVPFFEYVLKVADMTTDNNVAKLTIANEHYNELYRQLYASFFRIDVSDEDIEEELGTIKDIEIQFELQDSQLAQYRIVLTSSGLEQELSDEFILEGNFTNPNKLQTIPGREDL